MPTLLEKGKVVKLSWMRKIPQNVLDEYTAIDFISEYIKDRLWEGKNKPPKVRIRGPGYKVLVLRSGTGSGKSTVLPTRLRSDYNCNIIITQPTRITATDIPFQIMKYNDDLKLGSNIGYQTSTMAIKPRKGMLFSTYGILNEYMKTMDMEMFAKRYKFIIIDEVHKRTTEMDSCLYLLKKMLNEYYDEPFCPYVILTSATFEPGLYLDYFECPNNCFIDIKGASYSRIDNYPSFDLSDYVLYIVNLVEKLHVENIQDINEEIRDIIIFVQGYSVMDKIEKALHNLNSNVFSKGIKYSKWHSKKNWSQYVEGGNENIYIAPLKMMSIDIETGGENYQNIFSPIELVNVHVDVSDEKTEEYEKYINDANDDVDDTTNDSNVESKNNVDDVDTTNDDDINVDDGNDVESKNNINAKTKNKTKNKKVINPFDLELYGGARLKKKIKKSKKSNNNNKKGIYPATRRIILATNVAETGLTIPTLKYCIDAGFVKDSSFNPIYGYNVFSDKNVTKASSRQRRGRIGRVAPGYFYPVYTKNVHGEMSDLDFPIIIKDDISQFMLNVLIEETECEIIDEMKITVERTNMNTTKTYPASGDLYQRIEYKNVFNFSKLDIIEYPSTDSLMYSCEQLYGLGFIDNYYRPTLFGYYASKFRKLSLKNIRTILSGYVYNVCIKDLVAIACFCTNSFKLRNKINYKNINPLSDDKTQASYLNKILIADDFIEYLFVWYEIQKIYKSNKNDIFEKLQQWCDEHNIIIHTVFNIIKMYDEVINGMVTSGLDINYGNQDDRNVAETLIDNINEGIDKIRNIKKCIYDGYRFNLAKWNDEKKTYIMLKNKIPITIYSKTSKSLKNEVKDNTEYKQLQPLYIVVHNALIKKSFSNNTYEFSGDFISVMDGFVDVDEEFLDY